jgi:putative transposase
MIAAWRRYPQRIRMDYGPELISWKMFDWAARHDVKLAFIQPGKPAQSAYIERFNRTFLEDVLDAFLLSSLQEAREIN